MAQRVLLLGPTGINKGTVLGHLRAEIARRGGNLGTLDFDREILADPGRRFMRDYASYLSADVYEQARVWRSAWAAARAQWDRPGPFVLALHGTVVRGFYGVRMPADLHSICEHFNPDLVLTLIDDVYAMWSRTEARAAGDTRFGCPTLEQLVMARRAEAMVGDAIVGEISHRAHVRHVTLSVNHPIGTLSKLLAPEPPKVVYLSFPISAPREALAAGNPELQAQVNAFHAWAMALQEAKPSVVFVSPLAIDELPFAGAASRAMTPGAQTFGFDPQQHRWSMRDVWEGRDLLATPVPARNYPLDQADHVRGLISTDVGWRDNRLVMQADALAVFSPVMPRVTGAPRVARGVQEELLRAMTLGIPSFVWQPPGDGGALWTAWEAWQGTVGSMGTGPHHELIRAVRTSAELERDLLRGLRIN